jgi:hypothetical protein
MPTQVIRLAAIAALLFAVASVVDFGSGIAAGASADDIAKFLGQVEGHRASFVFHDIWRMAYTALFVPVLLGLFFTLREDDRPYTVLASVFFICGSLLLVVSHALDITLASIASDFASASGSAGDSVLRDADTIRDAAQAVDGAGIGALAVAIFVTGLLMLRSEFYSGGLGWLALTLGILAVPGFLSFVTGGFAVFWLVVFLGQIVWVIGIGFAMWRKSSASGSPA